MSLAVAMLPTALPHYAESSDKIEVDSIEGAVGPGNVVNQKPIACIALAV